jgi:hypothetical protein
MKYVHILKVFYQTYTTVYCILELPYSFLYTYDVQLYVFHLWKKSRCTFLENDYIILVSINRSSLTDLYVGPQFRTVHAGDSNSRPSVCLALASRVS